MKEDPELATKLQNLVKDMKSHQRQQLVNFCGEEAPALEEFDEQMLHLESKVDSFLES